MGNGIKINDGKGIFDKYGLIRSCVSDLSSVKVRVDELSTSGVLIVDVINRLNTLIDGLKKDEEREAKENGSKSDPGGWDHI